LKLLGIPATYRVVDAAQFNERLKNFDFDLTVSRISAALYPDEGIRLVFASQGAEQPGSYNLAGIADPAVDALVEKVIHSDDWDTFVTASKALDRVLRAIHFWVPQWTRTEHWFAYWDMFDRPAKKPPYDPAVIDTWWFDPEKAARIGRSG
jgi:microcin C transport system substrate-binding protein